MSDKPEHWAQSIRLRDIEDFYYTTFSGEYINLKESHKFLSKFYS